MKFIHTCWYENTLYVWAEQDVDDNTLLQNTETGNVEYSPFNVDTHTLKALLTNILWSDKNELNIIPLTIQLPTTIRKNNKYPLPSHQFLIKSKNREELAFPKKSALSPWRVNAVKLSRRQIITLFGVCQKRRVSSGIFFDKDVYALKTLYRFAGALIARGRFLPSIHSTSDSAYHALWQPVLTVQDEERLNKITAQIPQVAIMDKNLAESAEQFLNNITDYIVRISVMTTLSRAQARKGKFYSVHDAWLSALRGESSLIRWEDHDELKDLQETLYKWRRPVEFGRDSNITLMLKLHEPLRSNQKEWLLEVKYIKEKKEYAFPVGSHIFKDPEISEYLLLSLGQAALLFSPLERIKKHKKNNGAALTHQEAHAFINQTSALLRASGYEVILPAWCETKEVQPFSLDAEVLPHSTDNSDDFDLEKRFDLKWKVTLDGEPITPEELEQLLEEQSPLVYFRGRWIEIDMNQLQEALRIWQRKRKDTHTAREIMQFVLGGIQNPHGLDIRELTGKGWIETFLKTLKGEQKFEHLKQPEAFKGKLRPYQMRGFSWLVFLKNWGLGACLADDMGLGKTIQAIAFILHEKIKGCSQKPILIVGPTSILGNWMHEINRFAPSLTCVMHHGPTRLHSDQLARQVENNDIIITSYNLLHKDYKDLKRIKWSGFIIDEAQNIKNSLTLQAQAARAITADYRIALTGTPMENNVGDIWSLMDFLNPGLLGTRKYFRNSFFKPIQSGSDLKSKNRLRKITSPFILRRVKTDKDIIRDLPEKIENNIYCSLTIEQNALYKDITESFNREIEEQSGIKRRGAILAVLTHLKQVCNHPANYLGRTGYLENRSDKLDRLVEMLEEIFIKGESALIFTQYAEMGALIKEHLCQTFAVEMPFLYGGTSRKNRDIMIDNFQKSTQPSAFILSLKAGGTGLNLTRANHVFHYDRWWNPAVENQATDRAFRIGQKKNVMVHKFICAGTLEERIDALMSKKSLLTNEIISSNEKFLTELSNQKLRQLLQLSNAPVKEGADNE
jgi:SNF2 family DNA or RNA helicase